MRKILLLLISNVIFAQSIPLPKEITLLPPTSNLESNKKEESIKDALIPFLATKKYGIGLISYQATDDDYATGANFFIFNPTAKTIKYIWFTVAGENPVGDLVKTNTGYYKTLKAIGPIESNSIGEWSFDYVWSTDIVQYLKIATIKIQYMDGTYRTVKYNDQMFIGYKAYEKAVSVLSKNTQKESDLASAKYFPTVSDDDETVFSLVQQSAEFPGGYGALRKTFRDYLDTSLMDIESAKAKSELSFIVEKDGSITDVKAEGTNAVYNKEAIRAIKRIRPIWFPALINSVKVRSIYRIKL